MIESQIEQLALQRAYVPEHIPALMSRISGGQPKLYGEYLAFIHPEWVILVGYPLDAHFSIPTCEQVVAQILAGHHPDQFLYIGPQVPPTLISECRERISDRYYVLHLDHFQPSAALRRAVRQASASMTVDRDTAFGADHRRLTGEFLRLKKLPAMVAGLYQSMPDYLTASTSAVLLSARDSAGSLCAYYVIEQAARDFDAYILGCYSRAHYLPHASDLLFHAMVQVACERGVSRINLGIGVNEGILRFKLKWGGEPDLPYEYCICSRLSPAVRSMLDFLESGKL